MMGERAAEWFRSRIPGLPHGGTDVSAPFRSAVDDDHVYRIAGFGRVIRGSGRNRPTHRGTGIEVVLERLAGRPGRALECTWRIDNLPAGSERPLADAIRAAVAREGVRRRVPTCTRAVPTDTRRGPGQLLQFPPLEAIGGAPSRSARDGDDAALPRPRDGMVHTAQRDGAKRSRADHLAAVTSLRGVTGAARVVQLAVAYLPVLSVDALWWRGFLVGHLERDVITVRLQLSDGTAGDDAWQPVWCSSDPGDASAAQLEFESLGKEAPVGSPPPVTISLPPEWYLRDVGAVVARHANSQAPAPEPGEQVTVYVPCVEIYRAMIAPTDVLAPLFLEQRPLQPFERVLACDAADPHTHPVLDESTGVMRLTVRRDLRDLDVRWIARLLARRAARDAAMAVLLDQLGGESAPAGGSKAPSGPRPIRAAWPFRGIGELTVRGRWERNANSWSPRRAFVIQEIVGDDIPWGVRELHVHRAGDTTADTSKSPAHDAGGKRASAVTSDHIPITEDASAQRGARRVQRVGSSGVHGDIAALKVRWHREPGVAPVPGSQLITIPRLELTVEPSSGGGRQSQRAAIGRRPQQPSAGKDGLDPAKPVSAAEHAEVAGRLETFLRAVGTAVAAVGATLVGPTAHGYEAPEDADGRDLASEEPGTVFARSAATRAVATPSAAHRAEAALAPLTVMRVPGAGARGRVAILEVRLDDRFAHVVEIDHTNPEYATLIVAHASGRAAEHAEIHAEIVAYLLDRKEYGKPALGHAAATATGWRRCKVPHVGHAAIGTSTAGGRGSRASAKGNRSRDELRWYARSVLPTQAAERIAELRGYAEGLALRLLQVLAPRRSAD